MEQTILNQQKLNLTEMMEINQRYDRCAFEKGKLIADYVFFHNFDANRRASLIKL